MKKKKKKKDERNNKSDLCPGICVTVKNKPWSENVLVTKCTISARKTYHMGLFQLGKLFNGPFKLGKSVTLDFSRNIGT
jgi:hypothetical protein